MKGAEGISKALEMSPLPPLDFLFRLFLENLPTHPPTSAPELLSIKTTMDLENNATAITRLKTISLLKNTIKEEN